MRFNLKLTALIGVSILLTACNTVPLKTQEQNSVPHEQYSAETFYNNTSYNGSSIDHEGKQVLVGSDESGIYNLYTIDAQTGESKQLTNSTESTYPVRWFPNDKRILFTRDNGGNELFHLFVREEDGSVKDLTPDEKSRGGLAGFSKDGKTMYVSTNERDARYMDLYAYDATTYKRSLIFQNDKGWSISRVSSDGKYLVVSKANSSRDSDLFLVDLTTKELKPKHITPHKGYVAHSMRTFSADNQSIYYGTDEHSEFSQVFEYNIKTGQRKLALAKDWDVSFLYFSKTGRYQVSGVNADAKTEIAITDTKNGQSLKMPALPAGNISGVSFSQDESIMAFYLASDTSPSDLYTWKLGSNKAKRLTYALNDQIDESQLAKSEIVRYKSFDGLEVPAILYKPKQANNGKVPVMLWIHGGPGGQSRVGYSATLQHLVNHGYAIFAVNNRGSSGYGKTFFHLDDKKHGEDDLMDVVYAKKYLQKQDWVDPDRIGIMGGSYGGYMTVAALTYHPEEFKLGIDIFGVTNWVRTLNSIPPWWESFKAALYDEMGDPATDSERHNRISPLFHAKNITKPLMVIQGANDPRVLQIESDEMVAEVKKNGLPVNYVLFEDEGHGFSKKVNRIKASEEYLKFLKAHL
jgi:dipeptidyl aminopeptidase/acylaminoacyl peptidase